MIIFKAGLKEENTKEKILALGGVTHGKVIEEEQNGILTEVCICISQMSPRP